MILVADGDDEIVSPWALEVFNAAYQLKNADIVYTDCIQVDNKDKIFKKGWSRRYPQWRI